MKNARIISLLLVLCLALTLVYPIPVNAAEENGMVINKTATANGDGSYTIQLEAYATGSKIITETTKDKPTDIVLVLDQSGSMEYCIVCGEEMDGYNNTHNTYTAVDATQIDNDESYYIKDGTSYRQVYYCDGDHIGGTCAGPGWFTGFWRNDHTMDNKKDPAQVQFYEATQESCSSRINALKDAAENFVNAVEEKAVGDTSTTQDDIHHRIAMVGFAATEIGNPGNYTNTELFIGSTQYNFNTTASSHYDEAFQDMSTSTGQNNIANSIDALDASGGTHPNHGLEMANGIFAAYPIENNERNRVVIVFTDGVPGRSGFDDSVAESAIDQADISKDTYGATVYTVGVFSGADASSAGNEDGSETEKANWFMHKMSSNNGTPQTPSYYLSAGDAETLNNIFQQISDQIESGGTSSTLTEGSVVKDIIAPAFTLPEGASASDITLKTYRCTGKEDGEYTWTENENAMGATATVDGDSVSITGFDFSDNYVAEIKNGDEVTGYQGHKLVITFTVNPKAGYLGGNSVETNASAGIYENADSTEPIVTFPRPVVNVPINKVVVTNADDQNVYLYDTLTTADLKGDATVTVGDVVLELNETNYGLEEWQTADVNITVAITDKDGNPVTDTTFENLTEDSEYNVSVTVSPKNEAEAYKPERGPAATPQSGDASAKINVFKPVITFNDTAINLGETADYANNGGTINEWIHTVKNADGSETITKSTDTGVVMDTAVPTDITYSYSIPAAAFTEEKEVKVTVSRGNSGDLSEYVTFYRDACNFADCEHKEKKIVESTADRVNFVVHINTFDLTITKELAEGTTLDEGQTFLFHITKGEDFSMDVVINGTGSVTISGLKSGDYTVTEDTAWSWRYTPDQNNVIANAENNVITFSNSRTDDKWLDGNSYAKNSFAKLSAN